MKSKKVSRYFLFQPALIGLLMIAQLTTGCSLLKGVTKYDPLSYKSLTDLKPQVNYLYDTFNSENVDLQTISDVRLAFAQMVEYEKGKGSRNETTVEQAQSLHTLFEKHIKDRLERGAWSSEHLDNQKGLINEAFDLAISTEQLKNK
jgi:hypothetical protein